MDPNDKFWEYVEEAKDLARKLVSRLDSLTARAEGMREKGLKSHGIVSESGARVWGRSDSARAARRTARRAAGCVPERLVSRLRRWIETDPAVADSA